MQFLFSQLETSVKANVASGDFSSALEDIKKFVVTVMNMEAAPGEVVGSRKVDDLCELVGQSYFEGHFQNIFGKNTYKATDNRMVIVCTGLYKYGGTTLVMSDLVKAHPGYECTVIATNFLDNMTSDDLKLSRIGSDAEISVCPPGDAAEKLDWLLQKFGEIRPSRIFLLNHHQDSVIVSAASAFVDKADVVFYHHADYNICLGVHLKGAIHVDPHNVGFFNCRSRELISDNAYIPMTVDDRRVSRTEDKFMVGNQLTTCSSGHYHKFRNFYLYPYLDMIVERLKIRNGIHIHVGGIPDVDKAIIHENLVANDVDPGRFLHIPWTASFWEMLVEKKVDLLIGSFPIGGARTTIEAMGAGIPMLMPENYMSRFFSSRDIVYEDTFLWKYPYDFSRVITDLTSQSLEQHSKRSRAHYDLYYNSDSINLEDWINAICARIPTPDPYALYPYNPDKLDRRMHDIKINELIRAWASEHPAQMITEPNDAAESLAQLWDKSQLAENKSSSLFTRFFGFRDKSTYGRKLSSAEMNLYRSLRANPDSIGFDSKYYLDQNSDLIGIEGDPLLHFVKRGQHENRTASFFFSPDWHLEMNEEAGTSQSEVLLHLAQTRADPKRKKAAFFVYAWNAARRPDPYISAMVSALAQLGINVDVYVAGHFSEAEGTKGFRSDMSKVDLGAFLRSQSYDFALSFNNALVLPETVSSLDCTIVSILVDSIHHLFDHTNEGLYGAFALPIHAAPIYSSFVEDAKHIPGIKAVTSFIPAATEIEKRNVRRGGETIEISWIASVLGDFHIDSFLSRVEDEVPNGMDLMARCLKGIQETGEIGTDPESQEAAKILCDWSHWDFPLLEMHLQEIITNRTRMAAVERLAPLGLRIYGNIRWRNYLLVSPGLTQSFRKAANIRSHADLCEIYDRSKISINIPQMHAGTGMQYRVLDILASSSLLITQYVPDSDLERLFGANSPIVTFTDIDDLHKKCEYYLQHEDERVARVKACNEMVAKGFSFRERALDYLALSNPSIAGDVRKRAASAGSITLIWPDRVNYWASRKGKRGR